MDFGVLKARFFEALDRTDGGITAAARAVGVNRNTAFGWARQAGVRGRGKPRRPGHPGRAEYERLRAAGVRRRGKRQPGATPPRRSSRDTAPSSRPRRSGQDVGQ